MWEWWSKLRGITRRRSLDEELGAELDAHLQMEVDANLERGMAPTAAVDAARRHLGNRTSIHESAREAWMFYWFETILHDLRYGFRICRRSPGFTATAVSVLSMGIGATTGTFTL